MPKFPPPLRDSDLAAHAAQTTEVHGLIVPKAFPFVSRLANMEARQGVCSDGTHLYCTMNTAIHKRTKAGVLVDSAANAHLEGTAMAQVNHIHYYDGTLYVGSSNYDTLPAVGYIKRFRASDLVYLGEHRVRDYWCEGTAGLYDDSWWVIYYNWGYVSRYTAAWVWEADYELSFTTFAGGYDGALWIGDYLYCNTHDRHYPKFCHVYYWNGAGFDRATRIEQPAEYCGQGFGKEPGADTIWWAERVAVGAYNIVESGIEWMTIIPHLSSHQDRHGFKGEDEIHLPLPLALQLPGTTIKAWDNIDNFTENNVGGTNTPGLFMLTQHTGAVLNNRAALYSISAMWSGGAVAQSQILSFRVASTVGVTSGNNQAYLGYFSDAGAPSAVQQHYGWQLIDGVLYWSYGNGVAGTNGVVQLDEVTTMTVMGSGTLRDLLVVWDATLGSENIRWYVGGVLYHTATADLPAGFSGRILFHLVTTAAAAKTLYIYSPILHRRGSVHTV